MTAARTGPALVELSEVRHHFDDRVALDGVDLRVQGGIVTLLGANGAGKSTLLRCIATLIAPQSGSVMVDGLDPGREAERIELRRRLGHLPQTLGFSPSATVFDALDYFGVLKELDDDRTRRREVADVLRRVGLLERMSAPIHTLSGGMQRRLGLAQALLGSPSLLVLDEPSAGLDPDERARLRQILADRRSGSTTIVSTHLTEEAALADTVVVLDEGRIRFVGTPERLIATARGCAWIEPGLPPPGTRASWRRPDGQHRCLGQPPKDAALDPPTLEDGYLLLTRR